MKKKHVKQYILWILLVCLVAGLAAMPLLAARKEEESGPTASILSAVAQSGSVEAALKGGGILSAGEAERVTVPSGVKITKFLVNNGTLVSQGDPVAQVDPVSVMQTILEVRDTMDYLLKQIDSARDDKLDSTIRAAAGGRIKQVFAQPGDSVAQVMLEKGALAVLSLDGLMALRLEQKTSLGAGDGVCVILADGREISGRVESNLNGSLVVTVEDEGYAPGEPVAVTTVDGEKIGEGELYIHNAWKATGYGGTIRTVYAREEKTVSDGASLFALTDTEYTGNLEDRSALYREYEQLLQELFGMYESEVLTAPCDGIVSGVDQDSPFLLAADDAEDGWFAELLNGESIPGQEKGYTVMLLSGTTEPECTGTDKEGNCRAKEHKEGCAMYCTGTAGCPVLKEKKHKVTCLSLCISAEESGKCLALNHKPDCLESCVGAAETGKCPATAVHKPGCIESCISADPQKDCPATGAHKADCLERCDKTEECFAVLHHYPECLSLCTMDENCSALNHRETCYMAGLTYYAYAALVRQVGTAELIVAADTQTRYEIRTGPKGWELVTPAAVDTKLLLTEQTVAVANPSGFKTGDVVLFWTGYSGETAVKTGETVHISAGSALPGGSGQMGALPGDYGSLDLSGLAGAMFGGMSGGGMPAGGGAAGSQEELFDLDGDVLLTVTDHSAMKVSIAVDEQDITKLHLGQSARVSITALKEESFEAQITDIGMEGLNSGGSSKYTVELTLRWREDMLDGMSATAVIPLYTERDVLTVPVAALVEEPGRTVVYTALDPESGEPVSPVEVTTGVSDGQTVEILTGLKTGDTVYYSYYDTLELDHSA